MANQKIEPFEVACHRCKHTEIIYSPKEEIPECPECDVRKVLQELLREGKSY